MSFLRKVDHITYACAHGTIEKWAWFHMEVEGGRLIERIDDVRPHDPESSMKLWCIDYGEFGIALVEGIDRSKKSQVTKFVERHGDHACQHVAFDCHDLERFRRHLLEMGGHPRGQVLVRHDGFGVLKQMFAKGYAEGDAAEASSRSTSSGRGRRRTTCTSRSPKVRAAAFMSRSRTRSRAATRSR